MHNMKHIDVYVNGSYDYAVRMGYWVYYLSYRGAVLKRTNWVQGNGNYTRIVLWGLCKALEAITEPCDITVHSKTALGYKNPKRSSNKDLLIRVLVAVSNAGHTIDFVVDDLHQVEMWEQVYGKEVDGAPRSKRGTSVKPDIKNIKSPNEVFNTGEKLVNPNKTPQQNLETPNNIVDNTTQQKPQYTTQQNTQKTKPKQVEKSKEQEYSEEELQEMRAKHSNWKSMYSDLMGPSGGAWVPGSGGY